MNNPDDRLLSHCNRAKILIKLCILTVIAEHFCVFECMRVFIPVCLRGCVCVHRCIFFHLFSALILDLQYTSITSSLSFKTNPSHNLIQTTLFLKGLTGACPVSVFTPAAAPRQSHPSIYTTSLSSGMTSQW